MQDYIYDTVFLKDSTIITKEFLELRKVNASSMNTVF